MELVSIRELFNTCEDTIAFDEGYITRVPIEITTSVPRDEQTLWRLGNNHITMEFDCQSLVAPEPGGILIQELLADGAYGPDLSESFAIDVDDATLAVHEQEPVLSHGKWYAVRNVGDWADVRKFTIHLLVQVGDANNDGRVLPNDLSIINASVPTFDAPIDSRLDINGDGRILPNDLSLCNQHVPSMDVDKPSGH